MLPVKKFNVGVDLASFVYTSSQLRTAGKRVIECKLTWCRASNAALQQRIDLRRRLSAGTVFKWWVRVVLIPAGALVGLHR